MDSRLAQLRERRSGFRRLPLPWLTRDFWRGQETISMTGLYGVLNKIAKDELVGTSAIGYIDLFSLTLPVNNAPRDGSHYLSFVLKELVQRTDNRFAELSNGMYVTILEREVSKTQTLSVVPAPRRRFRRRPPTARDPPEGRSAHHRAAQYHEGRRQRYSDDRHLCRPRSQIHQGQVRRFPIWDIVFRVKGYG